MTDLSQDERELFHQLIEAAGTLATVTDNAAVILSDDFEDMVRGPIQSVREILERCPTPEGVWKPGDEIKPEHLKIEYFRSEGQTVREEPRGVRITHLPSGLSGESYSKRSQLANTEVVMSYLRRKLEQRVVAS